MKGLLDGLLVTAALVASIGYVLYALGPRALRKRIAAALGWASDRKAGGGECGGGCSNCGSAGAAQAGAAQAAPAGASEATEVHVPLSKVGKRRPAAGTH
jgi:hypothetical protein